MTRRTAIVHSVLAFALAALAWGPVSVCAMDDERAVCSCATVEATDAATPIVTVDNSATPDSRTLGPALAGESGGAGTIAELPPSTSGALETVPAPGAAPLFLVHCAFLN